MAVPGPAVRFVQARQMGAGFVVGSALSRQSVGHVPQLQVAFPSVWTGVGEGKAWGSVSPGFAWGPPMRAWLCAQASRPPPPALEDRSHTG